MLNKIIFVQSEVDKKKIGHTVISYMAIRRYISSRFITHKPSLSQFPTKY